MTISIHAPAKGATIPAPPRQNTKQISIHAPAKGATSNISAGSSLILDFNPRSREGSDSFCHNRNIKISKFQSTLPRRERRQQSLYSVKDLLFQSTLPRRERLYAIVCRMIYNLFQSTLPRRERPITFSSLSFLQNFNPRSREGSDLADDYIYNMYCISIHAPAKGATKLNNLI